MPNDPTPDDPVSNDVNSQPPPGANPLARFPVTEAQIDRVMSVFYARIRSHDALGPVFAAHIGDSDAEWEAHIAKIGRFWRNAILREPVYSGNPMAVHMAAHDVKVPHFAPWLEMFEQVVRRELDAASAEAWIALAHRIARGFKMQLSERDNRGGVPNLG